MITAFIFIFLIITTVGLPITFLVIPKHNLIGRIGLSYLLGIGIFTLMMYGANLINIKLTSLNVLFLYLLLALPLSYFERNNIKELLSVANKSRKKFHPSLFEKILLTIIGFYIFSGFLNTFYWPVYIWDALSLYDFRAIIITRIGFIKSALSAFNVGGYYFSYPLLTSLSHSAVYLSGGDNPQFLYSLFYLSLCLVFYGLLRESVSRNLSLIFTLMLISVPRIFEQSLISYTNLPYMCYFSLGTIYFYLWYKKNVVRYLILSSLLLGLGSWTRSSEPFWMVIFGLLILVSIYRKQILNIILFAIFFFPILIAWENFQSSGWSQSSTIAEVSLSFAAIGNIVNISRWIEVISFFYKNVINSWQPMFFLLIGAFIVSIINKKIRKNYPMFVITFALTIFFVLATFLFSLVFKGWSEIPDSAIRISITFYPLFVYCIALAL